MKLSWIRLLWRYIIYPARTEGAPCNYIRAELIVAAEGSDAYKVHDLFTTIFLRTL